MRYTQKDICQSFDIKRDTLRHYERLGIIEPEVGENGYRYYDDWQINLLWECKRYQAMGFSLGQIRDILHRDSLADVSDKVDGRLREMERELAYQAMALDSMRLYQRLLVQIDARLGRFEEQELPEVRFVPRREVHDLLFDERLHPAGRFVNEHQGVCLPPIAYFPSASGEKYYWGFAMFAERYRELGGPEKGCFTLSAGPALSTCVDAGERWGFGQHLFEGLLEEAARRGRVAEGPLYGYLLTRTYDERGGYHRFVQAYLPLAE
ncbi:MAG: MerR family transcriptional regulator [Coriobacteriales bacterium]|nr:MerR family transcriptional regulator [Coriobacteriales bacterium]